jgi:hypothetical protein
MFVDIRTIWMGLVHIWMWVKSLVNIKTFSRWTCITKMIHSHIANYSPKLVYKPSDLKSAVEISTQNHKNHSHNIPKVVNLYPSLPETLHHITTGKSIRPFKLRHSQLVPGKSC